MRAKKVSLLFVLLILAQLLPSIATAQPGRAAGPAMELPGSTYTMMVAETGDGSSVAALGWDVPWTPAEAISPGQVVPRTGNPPAAQAVRTVNSTDDNNDGACDPTHCSLREAVNLSASGDTIVFDPALAGATITLTNGYLYIYGDLTIDASALAERVSVSGNNASLVFYHPFTTSLVLKNLRIADGFDNTWAGCIFSNGDLTLEDCELVHCVTAASSGGAIQSNNGTLTLIRTRIAESVATTMEAASMPADLCCA